MISAALCHYAEALASSAAASGAGPSWNFASQSPLGFRVWGFRGLASLRFRGTDTKLISIVEQSCLYWNKGPGLTSVIGSLLMVTYMPLRGFPFRVQGWGVMAWGGVSDVVLRGRPRGFSGLWVKP